MIAFRHIIRAAALLVVVSGSSCSFWPKIAAEKPKDTRAWWAGDGVAGSPKIIINLSEQRVKYFKGQQLVGVSPISSGRENHDTMNGTFRIMDKDIEHRSSIYGAFVDNEGSIVQADVDSRKDKAPKNSKFMGASMRYFMRIVGGIGMHEGYLPGYPASHGCIRLPSRMAEIFFRETPQGTPVEITGAGSLASNENAIPLGSDGEPAPAAPLEAPKEGEKKNKEVIRRAIVMQAGAGTPPAVQAPKAKIVSASITSTDTAKPAVKKKPRPKAGETVFLD